MSTLGSDPAAVLRVLAHFDAFDESAANADTVIRAAALLAECPVGAMWSDGTVIRYDAAGRLLPAIAANPGDSLGTDPAVWLERRASPGGREPRDGGDGTDRRRDVDPDHVAHPDCPAHPLDQVVMDRLRHCLRMVSARQAANPLRMDDPALLEVVLSEKERREDRVRAMRLLGLDPARATRVLAVAGPGAAEAVRIIGEQVPVLRQAVIGATVAVLVQDPALRDGCADHGLSDALNHAVVEAFPASRTGAGGPWIGMGERLPAVAAATSWEQARRALRFASSTWHGRRVVAFERLGSLELLADMPVQRLLGNADVVRINEFASNEAGALAVDTLEAFCMFGTLRGTAQELHLHHSTVAARIAQVEAVMGWDMGEALDRFMATLVLTVRRIALSSAELASPRMRGRGTSDGCRVIGREPRRASGASGGPDW
ncbi:PucR family transcriptional regulator [Nocardia sp. NPDC059240]|uniref:PucR family transcriptional regulator n=1 Tax=Nocardia sp. NPDC059240 TaxID=3346786 RepID=UPI003677DFDF